MERVEAGMGIAFMERSYEGESTYKGRSHILEKCTECKEG